MKLDSLSLFTPFPAQALPNERDKLFNCDF
ncbi:MAG: hypothetical protein RLZ33_266, partial [Bacteroidota bacterium]